MIAIPSRQRSLTLLAAVLAAQVLMLAVQIRSTQQTRLVRVWSVELIAPIQRMGGWFIDRIENSWGGYVGLRHAREENIALRAELDRLKIRNAELEGRSLEADRLATLLNFRQAHAEVGMLPARVIGASPDTGSQVVYLDQGSQSGVRKDMGVITPDGVVGKVIAAYPYTSQVLLLGDRESGVGALLTTTRTQGPVKGGGEPLLLTMDYVSNDEKVLVGEAVVTSGQDRIFPKDLPVGSVAETTADRKSPFMRIRVKPAAHLDRLEEVLILLSRQELDPKRVADTTAAPSSPVPGATKTSASAR